jgi:hypothetical protein
MAILKQVWRAALGAPGTHGDTISELSVIREDRNPEILFSVMETRGPVRRRLTFALNASQAVALARFLAGVVSLKGEPDVALRAPDDEDLTPTKPGRAAPESTPPHPDDDGRGDT